VLQHSGSETDVNLRELWANLLAQEIVCGDVHPEVVKILSRLTAQEAQVLAELAAAKKDSALQVAVRSLVGSLDTKLSVSIFGINVSARRRRHSNFSEALLESLGLIEKFDGDWVLSIIGEEFVRSVAGPTTTEP
jgi:hypothetical protein